MNMTLARLAVKGLIFSAGFAVLLMVMYGNMPYITFKMLVAATYPLSVIIAGLEEIIEILLCRYEEE